MVNQTNMLDSNENIENTNTNNCCGLILRSSCNVNSNGYCVADCKGLQFKRIRNTPPRSPR